MLIGKRSMLAYALSEVLDPFDWVSFDQVKGMNFDRYETVINCVAFTDVDGAEGKRDEAYAVNVTFVEELIAKCQASGSKLIHYSTDYLFDGNSSVLYTEDGKTSPLNVYGLTKREGENKALESGALVIRTSWVYGPSKANFVSKMLERMMQNEEVMVVDDQTGTTTYTFDLARATIALKEHNGLYHFANRGQVSRFEWAQAIVNIAKELNIPLKVKSMVPVKSDRFNLAAQRPKFSALDTSKYAQAIDSPRLMETALTEYMTQLKGSYDR